MKIINKSKIPDAIFQYLKQDLYDHAEKGDSLSVTEILKPVQVVVLRRRYNDKIVVDAIDRLWILLGSGVHSILENEPGIEKIERLKVKIAGRLVSGKWDRIKDNEISDYKCTSAWAIAYGHNWEDWLKQLSIYRWLYFKVKKVMLKDVGYIIALLRDWVERDVGKGNYPESPALQIPFELLSMEETERIVERRVKAIMAAEKLPDDNLPSCSDKDRWKDAKGFYRRCMKYCEVSEFCKQWQKEKTKQGGRSNEEQREGS